ncbi:MAG TPA: 3-carboxy-cis,cis-muconate cycloisomerase [Solirubrobacterales bacterium]|jgi:3-carboxy-cis,cis-muconate cycloisomerase|nr:3-carboxy-cis,cis-muconate cycloisomerase [Solirubrobacterales bacterium]
MRLFSSRSELAAEAGDAAWLRAMLDFEGALAGALADVGLADAAVAEEIVAVCGVSDLESAAVGHQWDLDALGDGTAREGTPVPALLKQLRGKLSDEARAVLHRGATSQDVVDTAAMLVAKRALAPLLADLDAAGDAAAALADRHRGDLAVGRTLLQQALPITFGLRAAGWLGGLDDAAARLSAVAEERLALQFGGAAGTLASLGDDGLAVAEALARRLELPAPPTPWQTNRSRVVELAAALGAAAGAAGKVGTDVVLLAQTEVGEVAAGGEGGGSSTLPHKRNPVAAVTAVAAARRTPGLVATMLAAMPGEEERAAGAWQAEAETLAELLRLTGAAVAASRGLLEGLEVFPERMRANLDLTDGLVMAESLAGALGEKLGRARAQKLVGEASRRAAAEGRPLSEVAADTSEIADVLGSGGIRDALDPAAYLGATDELIDRALAAHRARVGTN